MNRGVYRNCTSAEAREVNCGSRGTCKFEIDEGFPICQCHGNYENGCNEKLSRSLTGPQQSIVAVCVIIGLLCVVGVISAIFYLRRYRREVRSRHLKEKDGMQVR